MRLETGCTQIYTGNGKGKTTAALGLCFRAAGQGLRPCMVQFIKQRHCGEHVSAERLGIEILQGEASDVRQGVREQLEVARERLSNGSCDVLVLDEILGSLRRGFVTIDEVLDLLATRPEAMELILTGRDAPQVLIEKADLVTRMDCVKHYYQRGLPARAGIEF